ncbi:MAG: hypothetical protein OEM82_13660 [Acidobacteriota bacterium]|nr:hypothetical protein [Acidobacteriota bacterium]MDH3530379.1 hypothetical protein [Acidobacteriota bacterium]
MRIDELREQRNEKARHFVDFPEVIFFDEMADHISQLFGCEITEFEADGVFAVWIEFEYRDNKFFVENKLGDYRFFVEDPKCEENILMEIAEHLRLILEKGTAEDISVMDH